MLYIRHTINFHSLSIHDMSSHNGRTTREKLVDPEWIRDNLGSYSRKDLLGMLLEVEISDRSLKTLKQTQQAVCNARKLQIEHLGCTLEQAVTHWDTNAQKFNISKTILSELHQAQDMQEQTSSKSTGDTSDTGGTSSGGSSHSKSLYVPGHGLSLAFSDSEDEMEEKRIKWRKEKEEYEKNTTSSTTTGNAPERVSVFNATPEVKKELALNQYIQSKENTIAQPKIDRGVPSIEKKNKHSNSIFFGALGGIFSDRVRPSASAAPKGPSVSQDSTKSTAESIVITISDDEDSTPVPSTTHAKKPRQLCPWVHGNAKCPKSTTRAIPSPTEKWSEIPQEIMRKIMVLFKLHPNRDKKPEMIQTAEKYRSREYGTIEAGAHDPQKYKPDSGLQGKQLGLGEYFDCYVDKTFKFQYESKPDKTIVDIVETQKHEKSESVPRVSLMSSCITCAPRKRPQKSVEMSETKTKSHEKSEEMHDENPGSPQDGGLGHVQEEPQSQQMSDEEQPSETSMETGESQEATSGSGKADSLAAFRSLEDWDKPDYCGGQPTLFSRDPEDQERYKFQKNERARKRQKGLPSRSPSPQLEPSSQSPK